MDFVIANCAIKRAKKIPFLILDFKSMKSCASILTTRQSTIPSAEIKSQEYFCCKRSMMLIRFLGGYFTRYATSDVLLFLQLYSVVHVTWYTPVHVHVSQCTGIHSVRSTKTDLHLRSFDSSFLPGLHIFFSLIILQHTYLRSFFSQHTAIVFRHLSYDFRFYLAPFILSIILIAQLVNEYMSLWRPFIFL